MLRKLRRVTKAVIWIVAFTFIAALAFSFGVQVFPYILGISKTTVAVVNGEEIKFSEFRKVYGRFLESRGRGNASQNRFLRQQVLDQLIGRKLLIQAAKRAGLHVSPSLVWKEIAKMPAFQENGKPSKKLIRNFIKTDPMRWKELWREIEENLLIRSFIDYCKTTTLVPWDEIRALYKKENSKFTVEYGWWKRADFEKDINPTDDELRDFYSKNKDDYTETNVAKIAVVQAFISDFKRGLPKPKKHEIFAFYLTHLSDFKHPAMAKARHILIKVSENAPEEEVNKAEEKAYQILERALKGEDFAKLAQEYSEDEATAKKGGDLGWFEKGRMVPEFDNVVFDPTFEVGTVWEYPVKTRYGFHIIKLEGRKKPGFKPLKEVEKTIVEKIKTEKARQVARQVIERALRVALVTRSLRKASKIDSRLKYLESDPFQKGRYIPKVGYIREISEKAFEMKPGQIAGPVYQKNRAYYIFKLIKIYDEYVKPFEQVRGSVLASYKKRKALDAALQQAEKAYNMILKGASFKAAVKRAKGLYGMAKDIKWGDSVKEMGVVQEFYATLLSLTRNEVSKPVESDNGVFIARIISKEEPPELENKYEFANKKVAEWGEEFYRRLYSYLWTSASIEKYLDRFYPER